MLGLLLTEHQPLLGVGERLLRQEEALASDVDDLAALAAPTLARHLLDAEDRLPGRQLGGNTALDYLHALAPLPHL